MTNRIFLGGVVALFALIAVDLAHSENLTATQEQEASAIIGSVMSPFCPGRLLSDCPSSDAATLREQIKAKVASGQSKEDVTQYMVKLYGTRILAAPRFEGVGRLAWLAPIAFVLAGLLMAVLWLKLNFTAEDTDGEDLT